MTFSLVGRCARTDPIGELGRLWRSYEPLADEFVIRAADPDRAFL